MIRVREVSKRFGGVQALCHLSFEIEAGELVGFVGPNGAGKTTALRVLSGFLSPEEGEVSVAGFSVTKNRAKAAALVGYMSDGSPLPGDMRVGEYLGYRARLKGVLRAQQRQRVQQVVVDLELQDVVTRLISRLSRGYRQRVALADALVANPPVLLLDEPTSGLDPLQRSSFRKLLLQSAQERCVLFSSHMLAEVEAVATRFLVIRRGALVADGSLEALRCAAGLPLGSGADDIFAKLVSSP